MDQMNTDNKTLIPNIKQENTESDEDYKEHSDLHQHNPSNIVTSPQKRTNSIQASRSPRGRKPKKSQSQAKISLSQDSNEPRSPKTNPAMSVDKDMTNPELSVDKDMTNPALSVDKDMEQNSETSGRMNIVIEPPIGKKRGRPKKEEMELRRLERLAEEASKNVKKRLVKLKKGEEDNGVQPAPVADDKSQKGVLMDNETFHPASTPVSIP